MNRLPPSPLATKGLEIAEKHLGIEELAVRVGAPVTAIRAWRMGHATMPERKFLKLVDILVVLDPSWIELTRPR